MSACPVLVNYYHWVGIDVKSKFLMIGRALCLTIEWVVGRCRSWRDASAAAAAATAVPAGSTAGGTAPAVPGGTATPVPGAAAAAGPPTGGIPAVLRDASSFYGPICASIYRLVAYSTALLQLRVA